MAGQRRGQQRGLDIFDPPSFYPSSRSAGACLTKTRRHRLPVDFCTLNPFSRCIGEGMDTNAAEPRMITNMHFKIMSAVHGNHAIPEGKGVVHTMTQAGFIQLDSQWDTWVPLEDENLHDQVLRVSFTQQFLERRERRRQEQIALYMQIDIWRARWEKNPRYFDNWEPPGVWWMDDE
jgi:hypothetical protein